jgi:hypothetical protein
MRMSMETAVTMALAMGRTLVMPPEQGMYLLWEVGYDIIVLSHFDSCLLIKLLLERKEAKGQIHLHGLFSL